MSLLRRRFRRTVTRSLLNVGHDDAFAEILATLPVGVEGAISEEIDHGRWAISDALDGLLSEVVMRERPGSVLEFGAGRSTRTLAGALARIGGGKLTSIEEDPTWCEEDTAAARTAPGVDYHLIACRPRRRWTRLGLVHVFDGAREETIRHGPFDMVLVDAPQYWLGRDGALPLIHGQLRRGALLLLDDAGRKGEQTCLFRWTETYPGLRLVHLEPAFGGRGLAALRFLHSAPPRISLPGFLTATRLALTAARRVPNWASKTQPTA